jgi:ParB-like chromosome segregation protein Spo0J
VAPENDLCIDSAVPTDDADLAISIRDKGHWNDPINDQFLLSGHRRLAAAKYLGLQKSLADWSKLTSTN